VLHVGAAVGTPIVGLYGSGDPEVWRPPGVVRVVGADGAGQVGGIALEAVLTEIDASIAGFSGPTQ
jgi:ADP-heptose:LPS heptosyltransferase